MKVIITGATGWVGGEVFSATLAHPQITHVVLLQRRPRNLSGINMHGKKLETIVHPDFSSSEYPQALLSHVQSASAIYWCLGGRHNKFSNLAEAQRVNVEYVQKFMGYLSRVLARSSESPRKRPRDLDLELRFVLCSGAKAEWNQEAKLWFLSETRRMKGAAEKVVFQEGSNLDVAFEAYTVRPAVILRREPGWLEWLHGIIAPSVGVAALANVMVELGATGSTERFWEDDMIAKRGTELMER